MAKVNPAEYMKWCLATGTAPSQAAKVAYEKHLAGDSGPTVRAKMERKRVAIFVFDGEGNQAGKIDAENVEGKRLEAGFVLAQSVPGASKLVSCTVGGEGLLAILPDGTIGRCFPIATTIDLATGETTAENQEEVESAPAHAAG